jgi:uncharacterized protein
MELTAAEGRILGCLIEQEAADPGAVPLTLNALRLACNRTTGRDPVVAYDDRTVEDTLLALKSRGLARFVAPTAEVRTTRYRQRADERWRMGPADLAVLAVLLLRGEQAVGEVRNQAQRLFPFGSPAEVDAVLDALAARTPQPFAARVPPRPGDRETRWVEVLTGPVGSRPARAGNGVEHTGPAVGPGSFAGDLTAPAPTYAELVARVAELERRLAAAGEWGTPPGPPPAPPVEVRARPVARLAFPEERSPPASSRPVTISELADLADRLGDIESRLARIEAELGALR